MNSRPLTRLMPELALPTAQPANPTSTITTIQMPDFFMSLSCLVYRLELSDGGLPAVRSSELLAVCLNRQRRYSQYASAINIACALANAKETSDDGLSYSLMQRSQEGR